MKLRCLPSGGGNNPPIEETNSKNYFNIDTDVLSKDDSMTIGSDGFVTVNYDNSGNSETKTLYFLVNDIDKLVNDTDYNVVLEIKDRENIDYMDLGGDSTHTPKLMVEIPHAVQNIDPLTFIDFFYNSADSEGDCLICLSVKVKANTVGKVSFRLSLLDYNEELTEDNFVYEK